MRVANRIILMFFLLTAVSCSSNEVTIEGKFAGVKNKNIIIEEIRGASTLFVDSTTTDNSGEFKLSYKFEDNLLPVFLRVRHNNDYIILIAKPNEDIELNSLLNLSNNYTVSGSEDSELIKKLNSNLSETYEEISRLSRMYNNSISASKKRDINRAISSIYIKQKQYSIAFIVMNSKSLASIVALHQVIPNGVSIFGSDDADLQYFKLLADSLGSVYPKSHYEEGLRASIREHENEKNLNSIIANAIQNNIPVGYPDISLKDPAGELSSLSDLDGKVIMLVMWSPQHQSTRFLNKDLKEIYEVYSEKGFEIYQVTLDENIANWISIVKTQNIPWVSVNDPEGLSSTLIRTYNIQDLPSNYIIDRKGDMVGTNLWGDELINKLNSLL